MAFGKDSDFGVLTDEELDDLYDNMLIGNLVEEEFEGHKIDSFDDLVDLE